MQPLIIPGQNVPPAENGLLARSWWLFLANLREYAMTAFGLVLHGTHAERLALKLAAVSSGAVFVETDRNAQYQMRAGAWVWAGGIMRGYTADMPSDLGTNDAGFVFHRWTTAAATDPNGYLYYWDGAAWQQFTPLGRIITLPHASRGAATGYSVGTVWHENDRGGARYIVTNAGAGNVWTYLSGTMRDTLANLPGDLGADDAGFLFYVTDYGHILLWNGAGWEWGPGEEGRAGEISLFAVAPTGAGWKLCDGTGDDGNPGTNIAYLKSDGTTANVVIPNLTAGAYLKAGAAYGGAVNAAVAPTTGVPIGVTGVTAGAPSVASSLHTHTVNLPGDPVPNTVMLPYFRK